MATSFKGSLNFSSFLCFDHEIVDIKIHCKIPKKHDEQLFINSVSVQYTRRIRNNHQEICTNHGTRVLNRNNSAI